MPAAVQLAPDPGSGSTTVTVSPRRRARHATPSPITPAPATMTSGRDPGELQPRTPAARAGTTVAPGGMMAAGMSLLIYFRCRWPHPILSAPIASLACPGAVGSGKMPRRRVGRPAQGRIVVIGFTTVVVPAVAVPNKEVPNIVVPNILIPHIVVPPDGAWHLAVDVAHPTGRMSVASVRPLT